MPINNFKLFDEKKANMMSDDDYAINQQRLNGVQSGVASSQLQNKTLYQTALMCYALAQLMAANGYDANDANAVSTFVNNLSLSMVQKVVDKATDEDISSGNDSKWVSAGKLNEKLGTLVQSFEYVGNGIHQNGYKRILQFSRMPKILFLRYVDKETREIKTNQSYVEGRYMNGYVIDENVKFISTSGDSVGLNVEFNKATNSVILTQKIEGNLSDGIYLFNEERFKYTWYGIG